MSVTVGDLKIIATNGGGMVLDAKRISSGDLKIIASNASRGGGMITLKNPGALTSGDLKIIASNSKGHIVFDFVG